MDRVDFCGWLCGFLWIRVDSCGFVWIRVDSCGLWRWEGRSGGVCVVGVYDSGGEREEVEGCVYLVVCTW